MSLFSVAGELATKQSKFGDRSSCKDRELVSRFRAAKFSASLPTLARLSRQFVPDISSI